MDYLDDDEVEDQSAQARKFHVVFLFAHLFAFLANICMAWRVLFACLADVFGEHNAHVTNKDLFEAEAGSEIERLVKGEVDG
jgi:hypothetical protein